MIAWTSDLMNFYKLRYVLKHYIKKYLVIKWIVPMIDFIIKLSFLFLAWVFVFDVLSKKIYVIFLFFWYCGQRANWLIQVKIIKMMWVLVAGPAKRLTKQVIWIVNRQICLSPAIFLFLDFIKNFLCQIALYL